MSDDIPNLGAAGGTNAAVTECGWPMNTVHVAAVPLAPHAPPHPPNVLPPTLEALNVTSVPGANVAEHCPLADPATSVHPIPSGVELTVPLPCPDSTTVSSKGSSAAAVNVAVTDCSPDMATMH